MPKHVAMPSITTIFCGYINIIYQNGMNFTEIIILVSIFVPLDLRSFHNKFLEVLVVSCHPK
jgi:hypothetical protein